MLRAAISASAYNDGLFIGVGVEFAADRQARLGRNGRELLSRQSRPRDRLRRRNRKYPPSKGGRPCSGRFSFAASPKALQKRTKQARVKPRGTFAQPRPQSGSSRPKANPNSRGAACQNSQRTTLARALRLRGHARIERFEFGPIGGRVRRCASTKSLASLSLLLFSSLRPRSSRSTGSLPNSGRISARTARSRG